MYQMVSKVLLILLLTSGRVLSEVEDDLERDESATEETTTNSTMDYEDYPDSEGRECGEKEPSFFDKWKKLYDEGKNVPIIKNVRHLNDTSDLMKVFKKNIEFLVKPSDNSQDKYKALEFFTEIDLGLSNECLSAFTKVLVSISNGDIWALKFLDSMGRPLVSGFAEGIQSDFGEYQQCLGIVSPNNEEREIRGKYCMMKAVMPFPPISSLSEVGDAPEGRIFSGLLEHYGLTQLATVRAFVEGLNLSNGTIYRMGICIPSQCSAHEFQHLLNALLYPITRIPLEVGPQCQVKDEPIKLDKFQVAAISIFSISTLLIIVSTGYDIYVNHKNDFSPQDTQSKLDSNELLTSFSIIRNTRRLFVKNNNFAALDTFRLLFIVIVHAGHAYTYTTSLGLIGLKRIFSEVMFKVYVDNKYVFVRNPIVIDALMTLSGFLLSYGVLRKLEKSKGRFNYIDFIFQRWIRFFILMFGGILFFYIFPLTGDGPLWEKGVGWVTPGCEEPTNLLKMMFFVHNFRLDLKEQTTIANSKCNPPTWFLSSLLQLTLIGPIFVIIYYRKRLYGLIAITGAILVSVFASIAPHILFNIRPYLQLWDLESVVFSVSKSYTWWHFTPNNYGTGFFVGIAFGYLMFKNLAISRKMSALFWCLSVVLCTAIYLWHNAFWRVDHSASIVSILLWHSIGKFVFCVGMGWVYLACCTGRGGYFNEVLSWHGFQPIARLSFGIYMLHYLVIMHRIFTQQYTYVMSDKYMMEHLIIDFIYDIILAYLFYILIESPFFNVFTHFTGPKVREEVREKSGSVNNSDQLNNNTFISFDKPVNIQDLVIEEFNDFTKMNHKMNGNGYKTPDTNTKL